MHDQAYLWVRKYATADEVSVLDLGGRNINGSPRPLFPNATTYTVLDISPGPNVHIVADAATWTPDREYDVVVCTEVFEHTRVWRQIVYTAYAACCPGGLFIATMAGPGRPEHSAVDGSWQLYPGEHYENIDPLELDRALTRAGFKDHVVDQQFSPADVRCFAVKPIGDREVSAVGIR